jgi:FAD linked oxidases, C-terminal domain
LHTTIVSHALDGNFHGILLYDKSTRGERRKAEELVDQLVMDAIDMEGTCTGEHGVGMVKKDFLVAELGLETVETMRRIKLALDPLEILNPGMPFQSYHISNAMANVGRESNTVIAILGPTTQNVTKRRYGEFTNLKPQVDI